MNRPSFIGNYQDLLNEKDPSSEMKQSRASVGKKLGLTKIGVHVEILEPGERTSWPYAESSEEEFAYVLEGCPDAWINGFLHPLTPGDFIAFPSGTGIAHTFLNNTDKNVLLLVGGEATKKENQYSYALHPEENEKRKSTGEYWEDCPKQDLGPHDGLARKNSKVIE